MEKLLVLKADPLRPGWYISEEIPSLTRGTNRWHNGIKAHHWRPPTDMYETEEAVVVRVEIAGMRDEDFSISLAGRILVIRGVRADIPERRAYHQLEIAFGEFSSEVELPCNVIAEESQAEYKDGFLKLIFPKNRPKKITIKEE